MSHVTEAARRRTFAIISHPDAGKTTLTENLLLAGGAIRAAGEVAALLGRDLAKLAPDVADCELALLAAHFDPAEALRPTWPLHQHVQELLQRAPGQAQGARVIGFGADAQGALPAPMTSWRSFTSTPESENVMEWRTGPSAT